MRIPAGAAVRVTRGGDGGAAVPEAMLHRGSFAHDRDNLRLVLVALEEERGNADLSRERRTRRRGGRREREGAKIAKGSQTSGIKPQASSLPPRPSRSSASPRTALVETADPFDCAHNQRDGSGAFYLEQGNGHVRAGLEGCPRRMYPRSQIVSSGVSIDSAFDGLAARAERMRREGLDTGRVGAVQTGLLAELLDARLPKGVRLRDVLHKETRVELGAGEAELERMGTVILNGGRDAGIDAQRG